MERASRALVATRYFECESMCRRALDAAYARRDFERMARILMPLQESRRLRGQAARDAGRCFVVRRLAAPTSAGFYLLEPPLVGIVSRRMREQALRARIPVVVMAREPVTAAGECPIVGVGSAARRRWPVVVRTRVAPPPGSSDNGHPSAPPSRDWYEAACEALGDAAISGVSPELHPRWRVDDLMLLLDAHPDHEKLHQQLQAACLRALHAAPPPAYRPRDFGDPACMV